MPIAHTAKTDASISFTSLSDISNFKHECGCSDFYIDRDNLTLVGTFTKEMLDMASEKYGATYSLERI
jgi:hypothetical protein